MKALIAVATGVLLISAAHAQSSSSDPRLSISGYGCASKQEFVNLDTLAMSGQFQAYRKAEANALASGACVTFNKGQKVVLDQTDSVDIPSLRNEAIIVQVHIPGSSLKYWMLGIQLWGLH